MSRAAHYLALVVVMASSIASGGILARYGKTPLILVPMLICAIAAALLDRDKERSIERERRALNRDWIKL